MSLITTVSSTPSRLRGIFRFLVKVDEHRFDLPSMARMLMPDPFIDSEKDRPRVAFEDTFAEGRHLGPFPGDREEDEHSNVASDDRRRKDTMWRTWTTYFQILFGHGSSKRRIPQTDGVGYALAWFLSRSPYDVSEGC